MLSALKAATFRAYSASIGRYSSLPDASRARALRLLGIETLPRPLLRDGLAAQLEDLLRFRAVVRGGVAVGAQDGQLQLDLLGLAVAPADQPQQRRRLFPARPP